MRPAKKVPGRFVSVAAAAVSLIAGPAAARWNTDLRLGLTGDNWEVIGYVTNLFDDDTVQFTGGGPGLGCCFMLGSSIDVSGLSPSVPAADGSDPGASDNTVMVGLPLFDTAFLPDPRIIGLRVAYRFGG